MSYQTKEEYRAKLRDPRWQRKRLEILQRDGFKCRICEESKLELQIHHLKYSENPWEGEDKHKVTLCKQCHRRQKFYKEIMELIDDYVQEIPDEVFAVQLGWLVKTLESVVKETSTYEIKSPAKVVEQAASRTP